MNARTAPGDQWSRLSQDLFGVGTPVTLLLFFASSVLSLSLVFQSDPESAAVLSAHGWGFGPSFWQGELWRLGVNQLLHTRLWHFLCNAYWFLLFGPVLEQILGSRRYLLQMVLAAWVIGLAGNLGWEEGGIGLSGLLYFQFGYLVRLVDSDKEVARVCDRATRALLWIGLLVIGPVLSLSGLIRVGNVVHLSGCLWGLAAGERHRIRQDPMNGNGRRLRHAPLLVLPLLLLASVYLIAPFRNPDWHCWRAYNSQDPQLQRVHYRRALELDPANSRARYNLGLVCFEAGDLAEAEELWLQCAAENPLDSRVSRALFSLYASRGDAAAMDRWSRHLQLPAF